MVGERGRKVHVNPSLAEDPNYIAYKAQEEQLKQEHMSEWVAFSDGQLTIIAKDQEALFKEAREKGITGFFYHQIVEKERVYHLRSPRIVRG
jgi:hypothetical protein